jgi:hypothetical protein
LFASGQQREWWSWAKADHAQTDLGSSELRRRQGRVSQHLDWPIKECGGFVSLPMLDEYLGMFDNLDAAHDSDCGSQFCPQCGGEEEHKANCPDA